MKAFARLYGRLDQTTRTNEKLEVMRAYFAGVSPADGAWAVYFLSGRRLKRLVQTRRFREWAAEEAAIPFWLFDECYEVVGDLAETVALLLDRVGEADYNVPLHRCVEENLLTLKGLSESEQRQRVCTLWRQLDRQQLFLWNKLVTGAFRVGVSRRLVTRALSLVSGVEVSRIAHRLTGDWNPTPDFFQQLVSGEDEETDIRKPYPFFLASPLEGEPDYLGPASDWLAEWKWDGIRAQMLRRGNEVFLWSRGEELISEQFPELLEAGQALADGTVLDGEILAWKDSNPLHFSCLQRRLGRKHLSRKMLSRYPVVLLAFDLLESEGEDIRHLPLYERRRRLEGQIRDSGEQRLILSPILEASGWEELEILRQQSRERRVEGLLLKRAASSYQVGRTRGDWWKWKIPPYTVDAVLIYAQRGHGKRANLYTDYTFGVWEDDRLVPFAKAYSGLSDEEIRRVDRFVRNNTLERFGPVRSVRPELVFEIAFEGIQRSSRHRSGVAVRFPRMARFRTDKGPDTADTIESVRRLLDSEDKA